MSLATANDKEVFDPLNLGQESNSRVSPIIKDDSITNPPRLGIDNNSLAKRIDKSIQDREGAIPEMST